MKRFTPSEISSSPFRCPFWSTSRLSAPTGSGPARGCTVSLRQWRPRFFWWGRWPWEFTPTWWAEHVQRLLPIVAPSLRDQPRPFFVLRDHPAPRGAGRTLLRDQNWEGVHGFDRSGRNREDSGCSVFTGTAREEPRVLLVRV